MEKRIRVIHFALFSLMVFNCGTSLPDNVHKYAAQPDSGFPWPYYLFIPEKLQQGSGTGGEIKIFVVPANTGKATDEFTFHDENTTRKIELFINTANKLGVVSLHPVFPGPESHWRIYTHALDRDVLTTDVENLMRLDLQLVAMIEDTRHQLSQKNLVTSKKILIGGFSAAGMFALRFTVLHSDKVLAAVAGSPGGWPIVPVDQWEGEKLRYPIGIADLEEITGIPFSLLSFQLVPKFIFMGDQDKNESVPYRDGYEVEEMKN